MPWLSTASNGSSLVKELWERIGTVMTNAADKNLKVESEVAKMLRLDHVPLQLLCKSHIREKYGLTNIQTITKVEVKICLQEKIAKQEPQFKSFLQQKKCIVTDVVIAALLKLVSQDSNGKSSSLSREFGLILEEDGI